MDDVLVEFLKKRRRILGLTQQELARRTGVGLRFIREMEQGKQTLRVDKINQVLALFGYQMAPQAQPRKEVDDA